MELACRVMHVVRGRLTLLYRLRGARRIIVNMLWHGNRTRHGAVVFRSVRKFFQRRVGFLPRSRIVVDLVMLDQSHLATETVFLLADIQVAPESENCHSPFTTGFNSACIRTLAQMHPTMTRKTRRLEKISVKNLFPITSSIYSHLRIV